jgi:hypothetical protein
MAHPYEETTTSPELLQLFIEATPDFFTDQPADLVLIRDVVLEQLHHGPKVSATDPWAHVAQHYLEVLPRVMSDPRTKPVRDRVAAHYEELKSGSKSEFIVIPTLAAMGTAAVIGFAIGTAVGAVIVGYCLGGPDPAPGESVPTQC